MAQTTATNEYEDGRMRPSGDGESWVGDCPRTMRFFRDTGYSAEGPEYGRLVPAEEVV